MARLRALTRASRAAAAAGVLLLAAAAAAPPASAAFAACPGRPSAECASVVVPLDRAAVIPGAVGIHVERYRTSGPARGALIALAGGPGQAATDLRRPFREALEPIAAGRDLVIFDQRGTGLSGKIACPSILKAGPASRIDAVVRLCAEEVGPARVTYTTEQTVLDMEEVRKLLGVEKVALYGVSYGTKVAAAYARRFPANVEAMVLDSAVPPDSADPFALATLKAAPGAMRALCARGACRDVTADAPGDLARLLARLRARPVEGPYYRGTGRAVRERVTEGDVLALLLDGDFDPSVRAGLPGAARSALEGDVAPLLRMMGRHDFADSPVDDDVTPALFLTTVCEEEALPWDRAATPEARTAQQAAALGALPADATGPFGKGAAARAPLLDLCRQWPAPPVPVTPPAPAPQPAPAPAVPAPMPDVPVLVVSGAQDMRTPPSDARAVAALFPRGRVLTAEGVAHSVLANDPEGCATRAAARLLAGGTPAARCPAPRPANIIPRAPRRLSALRVVPGHPRRVGQTLSAFIVTLDDAVRSSLLASIDAPRSRRLAVGGLRGGRAVSGPRGLTLTGYEYVPGVRVSGTFRGGSATRWRIAGPAAARGVLVFDDDAVTGRLGGVDVSWRLGP